MESYSLYQLNEYINRVIALNFPEPIWINAEIMQVSETRGNVYMELIEQDEDTNQVKAQISAAIWYRSYLFIKNKVGDLLPSLLTSGTHVLLKVKVDYSERYGIKLIVEDIDPSFTIGQLEMERQKIIERLSKSGVMQMNESLSLPSVIQNVAIISSETAAGYKDFVTQLESNIYGYQFNLSLFDAAMQGRSTEKDVLAAFDKIEKDIENYDIVIIIRGGGSKLDLAAFDNYNIGYKIATFPKPVLTGIGHEIDNTVADLTSHTSLKTPTAVANFIIDHNLHFENNILQMWSDIQWVTKEKVKQAMLTLENTSHYIRTIPKEQLNLAKLNFNQVKESIFTQARHKITHTFTEIENFEKLINILDPQTTLQRGFSIVKQAGNFIDSSKKLKKGNFEIQFKDGKVKLEK
jgi:exodeoxyribonuclease VII large subunit